MELAAPDEERVSLEQLDEAVEQAMQTLREVAESVNPTQADRFVATAEDYALRLDENLPPEMEPAAVAEIRGILIGALRRLREAEEAGTDRPLDVLDDFLVRAESIRHIIRDTLDEELPVDPSDPKAVIRQLRDWLPRLPKIRLAELLGIDTRTLQRWENGSGRVSHRAELVLRLVVILTRSWTSEGVYAWFFRPRRDLNGRQPIELLKDPAEERELIRVVREGRAQHGS